MTWTPPQPDSLGALVGADDVRDAVKATIDKWSAYYLGVLSGRLEAAGRIGNAKGLPTAPLPTFGTWVNEPNWRSIGTGQPAAFLVTVPATVGSPVEQGTGEVMATWRAQVSVQVFGTTWQNAADLTSWYEKAVRWCILQHRGLGDFAQATKWMGTSYSGKEHSSSRTEGRAVLGFNVVVTDAIEMFRGPKTVPTTAGPPAPDPTVETVIFDLTRVPVTDEV